MSRYSEAVSSCWKELALELDLPYDTISRIDNDHNHIKDKCYDMFNTWLQRSPDACWCHIVEALKMRNMLQLANDIDKSFLSKERIAYKTIYRIAGKFGGEKVWQIHWL